MPLYNLATRRLEDTYPFVTQVSKSSVNPDKWSFADGLGNPVYWFDGTASWAASSSGGTPATASHSLTTKAAGIEWDIQLNSASAVNGILGVAELGRGYYNWNYGAWTFGNRITGSYADLIGSWSFHTNKDNYAIGSYSIAHGYKNIAGDSADSVEGYFTSTVNDTVTSLNLNFVYDSVAGTITVLQPGDFTTELNALNLTNVNLKTWFYNAVDDILYPIYISAAAVYDGGSDRTYFLISGNFGSDDSTGNGILYYQSFSSTIKGEPLANHAEGDHTIAAGDASHAEGKYTWASAVGSHAEGLNTISSNSGSHAEGRNTRAKGDASHAEGSDTIASGSSAHAEGYATLAQGEFSHAEGFYTVASGDASHAAGRETNASGYGARAIGYQTIATGSYSHAEGSGSIASGSYSHAAGAATITYGDYSYAGGINTIAHYDSQTVVGRNNRDEGANDYFQVGDGVSTAARSNALGVNNIRFYASNSIFLPDLTDTFKPHILVFDTGSKRVFYYTGSGLGGGGGTGTVGPGTVPYLAYFDTTNTITSNTIRYDVAENRYYAEAKSVDICDPNYNSVTPISPYRENIIEPTAVSLQNHDGSNLYVNNIAPCSEQLEVPPYCVSKAFGAESLLKRIDLNDIPCYGVKFEYSLILTPDQPAPKKQVGVWGDVGLPTRGTTGGYQRPPYTETGTITITFDGGDTLGQDGFRFLTLNKPIIIVSNPTYNWSDGAYPNATLNISENYVFTRPGAVHQNILTAPHDNVPAGEGFQFGYRVFNDYQTPSNTYFEWVVTNDVGKGVGVAYYMYISFVTTILKYVPYP